MQTNSVCPSSSSNIITVHGGTSSTSGSDDEAPDACTGSAGKNSTKTNKMAVNAQQEEMVNWSSHACPYCTKSFESSQALGGHQNAHRQERDADRKEYLASRRARLSTRTIMAAAHHSIRSALPMLPHGASLYGSSSARGYGRGYGYESVEFVHLPNKSSVYYVGVPVQGPCPSCRRWFGYQEQLQKQATPIEYQFIPPYYEANSLEGIRTSSSSSSSSSSSASSAPTVIVLDDEDEEHEVELNMTKQGRLDLTLRL